MCGRAALSPPFGSEAIEHAPAGIAFPAGACLGLTRGPAMPQKMALCSESKMACPRNVVKFYGTTREQVQQIVDEYIHFYNYHILI